MKKIIYTVAVTLNIGLFVLGISYSKPAYCATCMVGFPCASQWDCGPNECNLKCAYVQVVQGMPFTGRCLPYTGGY